MSEKRVRTSDERTAAPTSAGYEVVATPDPSVGPEVAGDRALVVPFDKDELLVGRRSDVRDIHPDVALDDDAGVSHRHAKLLRAGAAFEVVDLGSANGTLLNGAELAPGVRRPLVPGDVLQVGKWTTITVRPRGG